MIQARMRSSWIGRSANSEAVPAVMAATLLALACNSLFLSALYLNGIQAPCFQRGLCVDLQSHPSSRWFGIPIPVYGAFAYLALLGGFVVASKSGLASRRKIFRTLWYGTLFTAIVSTGLLVFANVVLGASCIFCIVNTLLAGIAHGLSRLVVASEGHGLQLIARPLPFLAGAALALTATASAFEIRNGLHLMGGGWLQQRLPIAEVAPADRPTIGDPSAETTVVVFSDPVCPACMYVVPRMEAKVRGELGKRVRFVYRHYPLEDLHPQARELSVALVWAHEKGKFFEAQTLLHSVGGDLKRFYAGLPAIGFDAKDIQALRTDPEGRMAYEAVLEEDRRVGNRLGITGTPYWVVAEKDGRLGWALGGGIGLRLRVDLDR